MGVASPRRGLVLGCGGTLGSAWTVGALVAVRDALGWDPCTADALVGTSAGAEFVTMLGAGVSVDEMLAAHMGKSGARPELVEHLASHPPALPPLPTPRPGSLRLAARGLAGKVSPMTALTGLLPVGRGDAGWLADLAETLVPRTHWVPHPRAWIVAADFVTGDRVAFGSPGAPAASLSEAVRASWAVPGWLPPVTIGGRRYADGGIVSPTSADLLVPLGLDEVVVLAPMASMDAGRARGLGRIERILRDAMSRRVDAEVAALRAAGTRVLRVDPTEADLAVLGPNFMDHRRRLRVLETSLRTSKAAVNHYERAR